MSYWVGKDPKNKSTHNKNKSQKYMSEAEMAAATALWRPYRYERIIGAFRQTNCLHKRQVDRLLDDVADRFPRVQRRQARERGLRQICRANAINSIFLNSDVRQGALTVMASSATWYL